MDVKGKVPSLYLAHDAVSPIDHVYEYTDVIL